MPSDAECSFSSDSLDDRAIRDESSQIDSSTVISEFSSTKTLMNIGDEDAAASKEYLLSRRYSDSTGIEENATEIRYSWQIDTSQKKQSPAEFDLEARLQHKERVEQHIEAKYVLNTMPLENKKNTLAKSMASKMAKSGSAIEKSHTISVIESKSAATSISKNIVASEMRHEKRKQSVKMSSVPKQLSSVATESAKYVARRKIVGKPLASVEFSSHEEKKPNKVCEDCSMFGEISAGVSAKSKKRKIVLDFGEFPPPRHERRIQGPETSQASAKTFPDNQKLPFHLLPIEESEIPSDRNKSYVETVAEKPVIKSTYSYRRKYHTYPKSRIPVPKYSKERRFDNYPADPRMFPLEPREIDLESFQQLHTADSQEELQEFLLLESQCSGNLGLAGNMSETSYDERHIEDERGSMSDY
ncbi:uncharacterized protein LOC116846420 [Odontomachus brunneus]|uniref:uncharacterized protein LOC116846420 n=1 Tax=Odontomachus brunneus TaxID=486640 RepID=UPI0013F28267|nr:uncharacterized protein LOC116846420 [Odontomachus brunneus]